MNILLARHGETAWNREGRYQGHTDVPLSDSGEAQARNLGKRLKDLPIHKAVCSPLSRANRTAQLVLGDRAVTLETDDGFKEISHGGWEGKLAGEIQASHPEMFEKWRRTPPPHLTAGPGAESLQQVLDRAWPALERATHGLGPDDTLLIVAHDAVNRVLLCEVLGMPLERLWSFRQAPTSLNALSGPDLARLQVVRLNDSDHVAPLFKEAVHRAI